MRTHCLLTAGLMLAAACSSSDANNRGDGGAPDGADGAMACTGECDAAMAGDGGEVPDGNVDQDSAMAMCPPVRFDSSVKIVEQPGNVLMVFDRSGTMGLDWMGDQRADVAALAASSALSPIAAQLTLGALFFPTVDQNAPPPTDPTMPVCTVGAIDETDQLDFMEGGKFVEAFMGPAAVTPPLYAPLASGGTPLLSALVEADAAVKKAKLDGTLTVVLITDGAPNCGWDEAQATAILEDWLANGTLTYVVGLPGISGAEATLNALATAGGTKQFLSPDSAAMLEPALAAIAAQTIRVGLDSCEVELKPAAEDPDKLQMVVVSGGMKNVVPRTLGSSAGWSVNAAGSKVTLEGDLCLAALDGQYDEIRFEYACADDPDITELPPPKVPGVPDPILF